MTNRNIKLNFILAFAVLTMTTLTMLLGSSCVDAQVTETAPPNKQASDQELPSGEEVMARHIELSGGKPAFDKLKNRVTTATLELKNQGITLDIKTYAARPNKSYSIIESQATGKIEKGCTGDEFWEISLMSGPVIHEGAQKYLGLRESTFERFVEWQKIYESAKCTGTATVDDKECFEVVLTPKKIDDSDPAQPTKVFFDSDNFLIRKIDTILEIEAGKIPVEIYPGDYKAVDGIKMAHGVRMEMLGQVRIVTVLDVKHNIEMPADRFDMPDEVKELLK